MINTSGKTTVADSDAIIGLAFDEDALHKRCLETYSFLGENGFEVFVPYPIILEAATALAKDKTIRRPDLAKQLLKDYFEVGAKLRENDIYKKLVGRIYNPKTSKKNSPFDFYVLACAKVNNIKTVFSFDSFYKKNGLILAEDLLAKA
ncbi:MAG: PIN domain-containing protein [Patescibacteria group bacterium]